MYGQVTVLMHIQQTLTVYDQFGCLMYGQEDVANDVLEYVVFEKHQINPFGSWIMQQYPHGYFLSSPTLRQ